jgi:Dolichyl-phosphate-mannose-protein mannosyltransferase
MIRMIGMLASRREDNPAGRDSEVLRPAQLAWVLGVALLARLAVAWFVLRHFSADWFFHRGMEMGLLAQSIVQGHGMSSPFGGSTGPTAFVAPGYPLIISAIFAIFGVYSTGSAIVILLMHVALNLITIALIMQLAARFASAQAAIIAGLFWAISPPLIWLPTIFWDTSFTCCIMIGSVAWALQLTSTSSVAGFSISGALIAMAGFINPALMPALVAMLCWLGFQRRRETRYGLLFAMLALLLVFSPWPIRNARVFHTFIPLRSTVGFEMWMGNRPGAAGFLDESVFPIFNAAEREHYIRVGEVAYVREKSAAAKAYIRSHLPVFLALSVKRAFRFWTGSGNQNGSVVFIVHACVTSILGFVGLVMLARKRLPIAVLVLLPILIFPLPYYITHAEFRYRLAIDPLLTMLSACALSRLQQPRIV